jgi:uncharacterized protein YjbI with pentapeptide repeats
MAEGGRFLRSSWYAANLSEANFENARFQRADFTETQLTRTRLNGADGSHALFLRSNLEAAELRGACLAQALFRDANLRGANLHYADMTLACLHRAQLSESQWAEALLLNTIFLHCKDLYAAIGLREVWFQGEIALDIATIRANAMRLPEAFWTSAGLSETEMNALLNRYS